MAQHNLYRWGSKWLDAQQYAVIESQKKAVQDKLDAMQKDFEGIHNRATQITQQIQDDQNLLNLMVQQSYGTDVNGNAVQFPLPTRYYDIQREQTSLQGELRVKQTQATDLQRMANDEQRKMPQPRYTGTQKPFDLEGIPANTKNSTVASANPQRPGAVAPAKTPTTKPASSPTTRPGGGDY
jgi:hypothetical protein